MGLGLDKESVFGEIADQRVMFFKAELSLDLIGFEQGFEVAQAPDLSGQSALAGLIDGTKRVAVGECDQSHQSAKGTDAAVVRQGPGPCGAGTAQLAGPAQPVIEIGLEATLTTANAVRIGEAPGFHSAMHLDLL